MGFIDSLLQANRLIGNLSQSATNGRSLLGTLPGPSLNTFKDPWQPPYQGGYPPGKDDYQPAPQMPKNGQTRTYNWVVSRQVLAPDGYEKLGLFVNGEYPGPMIEANWGDTIQVTVTNNITDDEEGTSIHWHGFRQVETPWSDGVPSVSQCPIAPGATYTYSFTADMYGTSWWHAHYSAQYVDGIFGPMLIHGPRHVPYDIDIGPVMVNDYFHTPYYQLLEQTLGRRYTPPSDNNMINGKMYFDCSTNDLPGRCTPGAGISKFRFRSGARMRLRLINSGAEALQRFTIDNHKMTVIANDFIPVKPYPVEQVTLGVGQRTDIIVEGTGSPTDAVWMRSTISRWCSFSNQDFALAAIYYEDADTSQTPQSQATPLRDVDCRNDPLDVTIPFYADPLPQRPGATTQIDMDFSPNATGHMVWTMNNVSFYADYNNAILLDAQHGQTDFSAHPEWNVYNYGQASSIRLILTSISPLDHPMHLHGHDVWILAQGLGKWDGSITRPENPQKRDTQLMDKGSPETGQKWYQVIEWVTDNPGVWPLHCHTAWHLSGGMYINILERPDLIPQRRIPPSVPETCQQWNAYSSRNRVDQIDAGV